jgi:hypothetical protein
MNVRRTTRNSEPAASPARCSRPGLTQNSRLHLGRTASKKTRGDVHYLYHRGVSNRQLPVLESAASYCKQRVRCRTNRQYFGVTASQTQPYPTDLRVVSPPGTSHLALSSNRQCCRSETRLTSLYSMASIFIIVKSDDPMRFATPREFASASDRGISLRRLRSSPRNDRELPAFSSLVTSHSSLPGSPWRCA